MDEDWSRRGELSPSDWANLMVAYSNELGLRAAVKLVRESTEPLASRLNAGLQRACSQILVPANEP